MSIISVDTELLQIKSANVKATVDRISADVQAMKHGLDELQATWRGSAATNFQALVTEWTLTQGKVEARWRPSTWRWPPLRPPTPRPSRATPSASASVPATGR